MFPTGVNAPVVRLIVPYAVPVQVAPHTLSMAHNTVAVLSKSMAKMLAGATEHGPMSV